MNLPIKSEIEIKDEPLESSEDFRKNGQSFEQDSLLEEVPKDTIYSLVHVKDEIEIKDEPLIFDEEYLETDQHIEQVSPLEESLTPISDVNHGKKDDRLNVKSRTRNEPQSLRRKNQKIKNKDLKHQEKDELELHSKSHGSKELFAMQKRIGNVPASMLKSPSETDLDDHSSKILSTRKALCPAKLCDLLQTMEKNLTKNSTISSESEYSLDDEIRVSKRKVEEYENKIITQKKKIIKLQNENKVLRSKNASLETEMKSLEREKLNRSNVGIEETSTELLKILLQKTTEIQASLKTTLEEPSSRKENKEKEIRFGSICFPEKPFLAISRRPKNSLFVKDLVSLLWSEEELSERSVTGKKHYNSKDIKQPLTPAKRFAIEEALKDRLKKQHLHDSTIALELKLVNRYVSEKISDARKCSSRRSLNMTYNN